MTASIIATDASKIIPAGTEYIIDNDPHLMANSLPFLNNSFQPTINPTGIDIDTSTFIIAFKALINIDLGFLKLLALLSIEYKYVSLAILSALAIHFPVTKYEPANNKSPCFFLTEQDSPVIRDSFTSNIPSFSIIQSAGI